MKKISAFIAFIGWFPSLLTALVCYGLGDDQDAIFWILMAIFWIGFYFMYEKIMEDE